MASPTKKTKVRRIIKKASAGTWRKNKERREGTTQPSLALDKPNAAERAVKAAIKKA